MLRKVNSISDKSPSEVIQDNLIRYFDLGFLDIGAYVNIDYGSIGPNQQNLSQLTKLTDIRYPTKEVWQGIENWVFENDINDDNTLGVEILVDGVAVVDPEIDYLNGRVFLPIGSTNVTARYSYKWCLFTSSSSMLNPLRFNGLEDKALSQTSAEIHLPLPVVSFHVPPINTSTFYEMGREYARKEIQHRITCEVFAENDGDLKKITDIICNQAGYTVPLFCLNDVLENDQEPLNFNGSINSGKSHRQLFEDYPWTEMKLETVRSTSDEYISTKLHKSVIQMNTRTILCGSGC